MAAPGEGLFFYKMNEAVLRRWVNANPTRVNDCNRCTETPLYAAARYLDSLPLVLWLVDEKGGNVNVQDQNGDTPLHLADSPEILAALLDRGADPCLLSDIEATPLMWQAYMGNPECVARMLRDPRVIATVDCQDKYSRTALHHASNNENKKASTIIVDMLLKAGADPSITTNLGNTPLAYIRQLHRTHYCTISLLERAEDAVKASFLVKARRFFVISTAATLSRRPTCKAAWSEASLCRVSRF